MRTLSDVRSDGTPPHHLKSLEVVLPELTLIELRRLLEVLQRREGEEAQERIEVVRKEIEGRHLSAHPVAAG
jgi:hypothetical protein